MLADLNEAQLSHYAIQEQIMQEQNLERFYRLEEELRVSNATIVILEKKTKRIRC